MNKTLNQINIDYLFLDLSSCQRCVNTYSSLKKAIDKVAKITKYKDININLIKIHIDTEEKALKYGLEVSPTIRINGKDIQRDWLESKCTDCGDLCECAGDITCRIWNWNDKRYISAPQDLIIDAILKYIYSERYSKEDHGNKVNELNNNIKTFFSEKTNSSEQNKISCC